MADTLGLKAQAALNRKKGMDSQSEKLKLLADFDRKIDEQFQEFKAYVSSRISELLSNSELIEFLRSKAGLQDVSVSMKKSTSSHNINDYSLSFRLEYNEIVLSVGEKVNNSLKYSNLAFSAFINGLAAMDIPYKDDPNHINTKILLLKDL